MKHTVSAVWVGIPLAIALATRPNGPATWLTLTLVAVVPAAIMMYLWREPAASTSQDIQAALR